MEIGVYRQLYGIRRLNRSSAAGKVSFVISTFHVTHKKRRVFMAEKKIEIIVPLTPDKCYEMLLNIGSKINDWKIEKQDKASLSIVFKQGGFFSLKSASPVQTSIYIKSVAGEQTQISFVAKNHGLTDPMGFLESALKKLLEPFQIQATALVAVNEGILCPKCGREIPVGARFCPYDGTTIMVECPTCKTSNTPGAKFCSNCGNKL